jgi:formamidopyrimidine-DNA glycosylase
VPELPEVEVVRRGLEPYLVGRTISSVSVFHDRSVRRHLAGAEDFAAQLVGRRVGAVRRRGKYLWWALDDGPTDEPGDAVLAHLGMSGQFRIGAITSPHLRVRLDFADGDPAVNFIDQRTFGGLAFAPCGAELPPAIAHIAPDPFEPAFDLEHAVAAIRKRRTGLKRALLDQTVVSGIGNIYADEALWQAKLHYARPTELLTKPQARAVLTAARDVMAGALDAGGTSFDPLYVNVNGESGYFDRSLHAYGRAGSPCDRCGTPMVRESFMNRSSFLCRRCQPRPRHPHY